MTARRPAPHAQSPDAAHDGAEAVVLALCGVLLGDGQKDRGLMTLVIDGRQHIPMCPYGQWLSPTSPRPQGDPCSWRCAAAWDALRMAARWLEAHERPTQLALVEAT